MIDLYRYVIKTHAPHWRAIGIELKLEINVLDIISRDNPLDCTACFERTLDKWLKSNPNASWDALEVAITNVRRAELGLEPVNDDVYGECVAISGWWYVLVTRGAPISRLTIVSHEAKKKQAVCNERVSYLHVAPL